LKWKNTIANILISKQDASVETDPTQCILGKWYHKFIESEDFEKLSSNEKKILRSLHDPHDSLHDSAIEIKNNLSDFNSMIEIYIN
jgi:hypothetical protein